MLNKSEMDSAAEIQRIASNVLDKGELSELTQLFDEFVHAAMCDIIQCTCDLLNGK